MNIILEGPDGGGKSTLAKKLTLKAGLIVTAHGPYPGETHIAHHYAAAMTYDGHLLDRCWISEPIYALAMGRGASRISLSTQRRLEKQAREAGTRVIFCIPGFATVARNWESRRDVEYLKSYPQLRDVYEMYRGEVEATRSRMTTITYDYELQSYEDLLEEIKRSTR